MRPPRPAAAVVGASVLVNSHVLLVLALNRDGLIWLSSLIGATTPNTTLFFGALVFLMLLGLQFSVRLSRLPYRMRKLTRQVGLLEEELRRRDRTD